MKHIEEKILDLQIWNYLLSVSLFITIIVSIFAFGSLKQSANELQKHINETNKSLLITDQKVLDNAYTDWEIETALANYLHLSIGFHEVVKVKKEEEKVGVWYLYPTKK